MLLNCVIGPREGLAFTAAIKDCEATAHAQLLQKHVAADEVEMQE